MASDLATVEKASRTAEEQGFIERIVAHPADDTVRLIYSDWLEERDDPRGPFLRDFVHAYRARRSLPDLAVVPAAWADMIGFTIMNAIAAACLQDWGDVILALARPALRLEAGEANFDDPPPTPPAVGTTRLGGDPDLPMGSNYPTAADGVPLHFLGQFNLADFQGTIASLYFPADGLLSLFRPQSDGKNCYPTVEDCPRLVRLIPPGTPLMRIPRPLGLTDQPAPFRPGLRLVETLRLPASLYNWPGISFDYERALHFDSVMPTNLGGTAYILLGHVTHVNISDEPLRNRPDWVQLVLVPYFEGPDYGISDMSLSYQLPADDLKAGHFDRLEATFG